MIVNVSKLHQFLDLDSLIFERSVVEGVSRSQARRSFFVELEAIPIIVKRGRWFVGTVANPGYRDRLFAEVEKVVSKYKRSDTRKRHLVKSAYKLSHRLWRVPPIWAQHREILEMAMFALCLDPDADILMDEPEALLWYSKIPFTRVPSPAILYLHEIMVEQLEDEEHWESLSSSASRILKLGLTDNYEHALGMALAGFDDDSDFYDDGF